MSAILSYRAHARAVAALGLPLIGGHVAQYAIGLGDTIMLGWYGVAELAAISLASSLFFTIFLLGCGFAWAVMPMVAASAAADDETAVRRTTRMGLWLSTIYAMLALPAMIWSESILVALGQTAAVARLGADYLQLAGFGLLPALLVMVLKSYLAALERSQVVFWITVFAAGVNAVANYALIFGHWGMPELGIRGAAIGSIFTHCLSLAAAVGYAVLVLPEHSLFQRLWRPDWDMFGKVLRLGVPIGLTVLSEVTMFSGSAVMMGWLGTETLAAHGVVITVSGATFMVHMGLSNAGTIRAGQSYGRSDRGNLARGAVVVLVMSMAMALATTAVFLLAPEMLMSLFLDRDADTRAAILAIGVGLFAVAGLFQLADGAQAIATGLLRGVQDTGVPMLIAAMAYWGIGIPASYILGFPFGFGGVGVWAGLVLGLAAAGVLLMWRFWTFGMSRIPAHA
ncbi:MATE family efflux transporter [Chachezhania antarctica]|uniref:MATE family efflux transporter n=1 Tax=Chachezhania antarctica TaxID=2340860 RepID=UPI000EABE355|nr:MATE family efflux transporter [Chachezhania antarctica]|tara:strand:- start:16814 stop:18175 length:1362 start_codon:yes stop_codon:yes gene_type:complete